MRKYNIGCNTIILAYFSIHLYSASLLFSWIVVLFNHQFWAFPLLRTSVPLKEYQYEEVWFRHPNCYCSNNNTLSLGRTSEKRSIWMNSFVCLYVFWFLEADSCYSKPLFPAGYKVKKDYSIIKTPVAHLMRQISLTLRGSRYMSSGILQAQFLLLLIVLLAKLLSKVSSVTKEYCCKNTSCYQMPISSKIRSDGWINFWLKYNSTNLSSYIWMFVPQSLFQCQAIRW